MREKIDVIAEAKAESPGWAKLIEEIDLKISKVDPHYKAFQVKEKMGGLRFYFDSKLADSDFRREVLELTYKSYKICSQCGSTQNVETRTNVFETWIGTLCDNCRKGR